MDMVQTLPDESKGLSYVEI